MREKELSEEEKAIKVTEEAIERAQALQEKREKETAAKETGKAGKVVREEIREEEAKKRQFEGWTPKTLAGRLVKNNEVSSLDKLYDMNLPIIEPEILDALLPGLEEKVVDFSKTTKVTKAGRSFSFRAIVLIGDKNGHVGLGTGKDKERWSAVKKASREAKLNLVKVRRGCGAWECVCSGNHSIPFKVSGKEGSVTVNLLPAPKGIGLRVGNAIKPVLELAGVKDVWVYTSGNSKTTLNFIHATINALDKTTKMRVSDEIKKLIERSD